MSGKVLLVLIDHNETLASEECPTDDDLVTISHKYLASLWLLHVSSARIERLVTQARL